MLRRADRARQTRAHPDNLPEWKQVDLGAPVWMLRHVPKLGARARVAGATAAVTRDGFQIVYIPKSDSDVSIKAIHKSLLPESLFPTRLLRDQLKIAVRPDGTVVLSCDQKPGEDTMWFAWQLYRLQAFELFLGEE